MTEFYANKNWSSQEYTDTICKECAGKEVTDRESARKYCWENNRLWQDALWDAAEKRADQLLQNNQEYISKKTSKKKKEEIESRVVTSQFFA